MVKRIFRIARGFVSWALFITAIVAVIAFLLEMSPTSEPEPVAEQEIQYDIRIKCCERIELNESSKAILDMENANFLMIVHNLVCKCAEEETE